MSSSPGPDSNTPLARSLLNEPFVSKKAPGRWAYPNWMIAGITIFVAYHLFCLLVLNLPNKGIARGIVRWANDHMGARQYFKATGNGQGWGMFAPNPFRSNVFMRVYVEDKDGEIWDLGHDIYGRRTYPYLFYDRMGKLNRRIYGAKHYLSPYAAWVCREWERSHGGEPAKEVRFVKLWTKIPDPDKVRRGFDPMKLHLHEADSDSYRCESIVHGQLPNELRERYGLPPRPDGEFRDVRIRTWWDRQQSKQGADEPDEEEPGDDQ